MLCPSKGNDNFLNGDTKITPKFISISVLALHGFFPGELRFESSHFFISSSHPFFLDLPHGSAPKSDTGMNCLSFRFAKPKSSPLISLEHVLEWAPRFLQTRCSAIWNAQNGGCQYRNTSSYDGDGSMDMKKRTYVIETQCKRVLSRKTGLQTVVALL